MGRSAVETVRRQNLSLVLSHLHRDGALSRADLTRRTGLNRSTVAALVEQSRSNKWMTLPLVSARICTSTWRGFCI